VASPRVLRLGATALVSSAATLWVLLVGLAPNEPVVAVSFDTLTADLQAGQVNEIQIHGRDYTYRRQDTRSGSPLPRAIGPEPTLTQVRALCPVTSARCPRIVFEP
jgi:hypothetical protein